MDVINPFVIIFVAPSATKTKGEYLPTQLSPTSRPLDTHTQNHTKECLNFIHTWNEEGDKVPSSIEAVDFPKIHRATPRCQFK